MSKSDDKMGCAEVLLFCAVTGVVIVSALHVEVTVWRWHFVPLGLPPITWRTALAFSVLVGMFRMSPRPEDERTRLEKWTHLLGCLLGVWLGYGIAALVRP